MRYIATDYSFSVTRVVKSLIIANIGVWFFLVLIFQNYFASGPVVFKTFGLLPAAAVLKYQFWQFFTYMFLHASGLFHLLFNMFVLWMFGSELERRWGSRLFLTYYVFSGVGAAVIYTIGCLVYVYGLSGDSVGILGKPVIGASGAVFGLLLAYGLIYSERVIYFMMIFPIKARHFTLLIAGIELVTILEHGFSGPIANLAHLGGLVSGFVFLKGRAYLQRSQLRRLRKGAGTGKARLKVLNNHDNKGRFFKH